KCRTMNWVEDLPFRTPATPGLAAPRARAAASRPDVAHREAREPGNLPAASRAAPAKAQNAGAAPARARPRRKRAAPRRAPRVERRAAVWPARAPAKAPRRRAHDAADRDVSGP